MVANQEGLGVTVAQLVESQDVTLVGASSKLVGHP